MVGEDDAKCRGRNNGGGGEARGGEMATGEGGGRHRGGGGGVVRPAQVVVAGPAVAADALLHTGNSRASENVRLKLRD